MRPPERRQGGGECSTRATNEQIAAAATEPRYEKGDRVFIRGALGPRLPGVVVGHHVDWNLYRVVYMVGIAGQCPRR